MIKKRGIRLVSQNALDAHYLKRCPANYTPLTPLHWLERSRDVYGDNTAVIHHNDIKYTYTEYADRIYKLGSALQNIAGVKKGSTVSVMLNNTPAMLESHFAVPLIGGILNPLNFRLDAATLAFTLEHAESEVLITDSEYAPIIKEALKLLPENKKPFVIDVTDDLEYEGSDHLVGKFEYNDFLNSTDISCKPIPLEDEWFPISLNYTSGTTGNPKGVLLSHRGAYLNSMGDIISWSMKQNPVYLWTLPMFHCNGWCYPWAITMHGGTHVCLRRVSAKNMFDSFADHGVTHFCGAPIVMSMLTNATENEKREYTQQIEMMTAAAPPPAATLAAMSRLGIKVTHVYGLTEVYGPVVVCTKQDHWGKEDIETQAALNSRQGIRYPTLEGLMVADPETLEPVPNDGTTIGEIFMKGNTLFNGYLKNEKATVKDFKGGWFHTGDLAVSYPDNYIQIKDRSKDIIISGGENISSIEIEDILHKHPDVSFVAVVAKDHEKWGEVPAAFVELRHESETSKKSKEELNIEFKDHCRKYLAGFKQPKHFEFGPLPKTSTGKIQKFVLREKLKIPK